MIFTHADFEEAKSKSRTAKKCKKISDLKKCLTDINKFFDDLSTSQILEFIENQVDELGAHCLQKNLLVAKDYKEISKEMADEFHSLEARNKFNDAVKLLEYHPIELKKKLIDIYKQLKMEEKIDSMQNKKQGFLEAIFFNLNPDQYKEKWKNEIAAEAEERFRTDSVKTYEKQKEELDNLKKVLSDIKLLQKFKNNVETIDKINLSIREAYYRYSKDIKQINKFSDSINGVFKAVEVLPDPSTPEEHEEEKAALKALRNWYQELERWQIKAEAILKSNKYPIDYLENLIKVIQHTWFIFLSIMKLGKSLNALKVENISCTYTHGKEAEKAILTLKVNNSHPVPVRGKTGRNLYKLLNNPSKVFSQNSAENEKIKKDFNRTNERIFKKWKKFGFAPGDLEFIHSEGYTHKIPREIKQLIR